MPSESVRAGCLAAVLICLTATTASADDAGTTPTRSGSAVGLIEQLDEDAGKVADKAAELGERAGESAEKAADSAAGEAEDIFERAKRGGKKAYEWSKRQLEEIF